MKPTINPDEILPDPKDDEVGDLLAELQAGESWTAPRLALRDSLVEKLRSLNYQTFTANKLLYGLSGVGDSILYRVPLDKSGNLSPFCGKTVRLVCVRSVKSLGFKHEIMLGPYRPNP